MQNRSILQGARQKCAIFSSFWQLFHKNREFLASYVKICCDFGVLCMHNFVVFMRKNRPKFSPPMIDLWIRPLLLRQVQKFLATPILWRGGR